MDLPLLLAQLEATKFRRLFRHMTERSEPRDNLSVPARPVGLPTAEPSKFFAYDFKGKFARFEFSDVSATIDNDRSIFRVAYRGAYAAR
jgi:hypothetical protein